MKNVYYDPEAFGLRILGSVEFSSGSYEFDTYVVFVDEQSGALFSAHDSGCSCPLPFERYDRSNLTPITRTQDVIDATESLKEYVYDESRMPSVVDAIGRLVEKVRDASRAAA